MNIGIDVNPLVTGHRFRGIGVYVKHLLQALLDAGTGHQFFLYYSYKDDGILSSQPAAVPRLLANQVRSFYEWVQHDQVEVLHITDFYHPIYTAADLGRMKEKGVKLIMSLADVIPLRFPAKYPAEKRFIEENLLPLLPFIDKILAISTVTRQDLLDYLAIPPAKVIVIHLGVDHQFFCPQVQERDFTVLHKYGILPPYFLYVGGFDWRKNCETILRAFANLSPSLVSRVQLVLVGHDPPTPPMKEILLTLPQKPIITGFVPIEDLPPLYRHAAALLFPSLYEGFGLPVLEAMACGTPVIASHRSSLPEIIGDSGILLPPTDVFAWQKAVESIMQSPTLVARLRQKGLERTSAFTWKRCADRTLEAYCL